MTGVELVLAALAAGASSGLTEAATSAVRDAYEGLRDAVRRRLATRGEGSARLLETYEAEPGVWEVTLGDALRAAGAEQDQELLAAARQLLDRAGAAPRFQIDASQAKGVQIGDHNTQTNHFN